MWKETEGGDELGRELTEGMSSHPLVLPFPFHTLAFCCRPAELDCNRSDHRELLQNADDASARSVQIRFYTAEGAKQEDDRRRVGQHDDAEDASGEASGSRTAVPDYKTLPVSTTGALGAWTGWAGTTSGGHVELELTGLSSFSPLLLVRSRSSDTSCSTTARPSGPRTGLDLRRLRMETRTSQRLERSA